MNIMPHQLSLSSLLMTLIVLVVSTYASATMSELFKSYKKEFEGLISYDDIIYSSLRIPYNSINFNIQVWALESKINPKILLSYDKIPTIESNEIILDIPTWPSLINIQQIVPTPGVLYFAFWGGKELHSYRYFAGDKIHTLVGLVLEVSECQSDMYLAPSCDSIDQVYFRDVNKNVNKEFELQWLNHSESYTMSIPEMSELIEISIEGISFDDVVCPNYDQSVYIALEFYNNYPSQKVEEYSSTSKLFSLSKFCNVGSRSQSITGDELSLSIVSPIPGNSIIKIHVMIGNSVAVEDYNSHIIKRLAHKPSLWNVTYANHNDSSRSHPPPPLRYRRVAQLQNNGNPSLTTASLGTVKLSFINRQEPIDFPREVSSMVVEMNSLSSFSARGNFVEVPNSSGDDKQPFNHVYEMPMADIRIFDLLFNSFQIVLKLKTVSFGDSRTAVAALQRKMLVIAVRLGNVPSCNLTLLTGSRETNTQAKEFMASCSDSLYVGNVISAKLETDENDDKEVYLRYSWTLTKPHLPYTDRARSLFIAVGRLKESKVVAEEWNSPFEISVEISAEPCLPNTCTHGTCVMQSTNIISSTCICKFPWAGENCEDLSMTKSQYATQVSLLVVSNMAILPALMYSYRRRLSFLFTIFMLIALSSSLYHLCDTDVYCVAGLSFDSLHVLDVLFSGTAIIAVIMFYAPISAQSHASWTLLFLGMLISPIIDDPTDTLSIGIVIVAASLVAVCTWIKWWILRELSIPALERSTLVNCFYRSRNNRMKPTGVDYAVVSQTDDRHGNRDGDSRDIELTSIIVPTPVTSVTADYDLHVLSGDDPLQELPSPLELAAARHDELLRLAAETKKKNNKNISIKKEINIPCSAPSPYIVYISLGVSLSICGVALFACQSRLSYWYLHSLWHIFMMLAACLLIIGRQELFRAYRIISSTTFTQI